MTEQEAPGQVQELEQKTDAAPAQEESAAPDAAAPEVAAPEAAAPNTSAPGVSEAVPEAATPVGGGAAPETVAPMELDTSVAEATPSVPAATPVEAAPVAAAMPLQATPAESDAAPVEAAPAGAGSPLQASSQNSHGCDEDWQTYLKLTEDWKKINPTWKPGGGGLAAYGEEEVSTALNQEAISVVFVSERLEQSRPGQSLEAVRAGGGRAYIVRGADSCFKEVDSFGCVAILRQPLKRDPPSATQEPVLKMPRIQTAKAEPLNNRAWVGMSGGAMNEWLQARKNTWAEKTSEWMGNSGAETKVEGLGKMNEWMEALRAKISAMKQDGSGPLPPGSLNAGPIAKTGEIPCFFWKTTGTCKHGESCKFLHGVVNATQAPASLGPLWNIPLDEKERLVMQVKNFKRKGESYKQAWYNFCGTLGSAHYDPARHEIPILKKFMSEVQKLEEFMRGLGPGDNEANFEIALASYAGDPTQTPLSPSYIGVMLGTNDCKYWKSTGGCWAGSNCKFAHGENDNRPAPAPQAPAPQVAPEPPAWAKPGDWICPKCNDLQFARNLTCRMCGGTRPDVPGAAESPGTSVPKAPVATPPPAIDSALLQAAFPAPATAVLTDPTLITFADRWSLRYDARELLASLTPLAKQQVVDEFAPKDTTRDVNNVFMKFARGKERHLAATQGGATGAVAGVNPAPPPAANPQALALQQYYAAAQMQQIQQVQQYQQYIAMAAQVQQAMAAQQAQVQMQQQGMTPQMTAQAQVQQGMAAQAQMQQLQQAGQLTPQLAQALQLQVQQAQQAQTMLSQAAAPQLGTPQLALASSEASAAPVAQPQLALPSPEAATNGVPNAAAAAGFSATMPMPLSDASAAGQIAQPSMTAPAMASSFPMTQLAPQAMPDGSMPQMAPQAVQQVPQMPQMQTMPDGSIVQMAPQALQAPGITAQLQYPLAAAQLQQPVVAAQQLQSPVPQLQPAVAAAQADANAVPSVEVPVPKVYSEEERNTMCKNLRQELRDLGSMASLQDNQSIPRVAQAAREKYLPAVGAFVFHTALGDVFEKAKFTSHRKSIVYVLHELLVGMRKSKLAEQEEDFIPTCLSLLERLGGLFANFDEKEREDYKALVDFWERRKVFQRKEDLLQVKRWWGIDLGA